MEGEIQPYLALETNFGARIYLYQMSDESVVGKTGHQPPVTFPSKTEADQWLQHQVTGRTVTELKPEDSPSLASWVKFEEYQVEKVEVLTPQIRVEREQSAGSHSRPNQQQAEPLQPEQSDRAVTKDSNNNRPEGLADDPADYAPEQSNAPRADKTEPETNENSNAPESFGDQTEREVSEFFGEGQEGVAGLKGQLGDYVLEGGSPVLGALGATGLDALNFTMDFAEGTITGILDTRNLGEGVKKGTLEGVKEDAARVLNIAEKVIPEARAIKVLGTALTVSDLAQAAANRDAGALAVGGGLAALSLIGGRGGKGNRNKGGGGSRKKKFKSYQDLPSKVGWHRHHIALAAIFRRAKSAKLRALADKVSAEYVSEPTHKAFHKIINDRLRMKNLFPGSGKNDKNSFTTREVEQAIRELIRAYERENVQDYADDLKDLLKNLKTQGLL